MTRVTAESAGGTPGDSFHTFVAPELNLAGGVVLSTTTCREARRLHRLAPTSCVALGRLLTAAAAAGFVQRRGALSLQIVGNGHMGQLFADVTPEGNLRGYVKNPTLSLPQDGKDPPLRHAVGGAIGRGQLSVIYMGQGHTFSQSTTELVSGEVDLDVEAFLDRSDQVPTALVCDVLLDGAEVALAAGVIVQALPGGDPGAVLPIRQALRDTLATRLHDEGPDPETLIKGVLPQARRTGEPQALRWKCRCSQARAEGSLKMLGPHDLAQMVDDKETAEVVCEFCSTRYEVPPDTVEKVFLDTITGRG